MIENSRRSVCWLGSSLKPIQKLPAGFACRLNSVDDPHVERLLEGVAFLGARVHQRLDDEFPELTDALLGVLYPHYLAPFPSCSIAQFHCQADLDAPVTLPAGIAVGTEPVRGETCRFRTAWSQTLWPIEIEAVRLSGLPLVAPPNPRAAGAVAVLRIGLRCLGDTDLTTLHLDRLRFFLRAAANVSLPLLELLSAHAVSVAYADGPSDPRPAILPPSAIQPVGFAPDEALFPWPARSFSGFRLLTEYFAFPEKFQFLDFTGIETKTLLRAGRRLEIFVYLNRALPELERLVGADTLALGCTPIVNLFSQRCEPIALVPHRHGIPRGAGCTPTDRDGGLAGRARPGNPGGWQGSRVGAVLPAVCHGGRCDRIGWPIPDSQATIFGGGDRNLSGCLRSRFRSEPARGCRAVGRRALSQSRSSGFVAVWRWSSSGATGRGQCRGPARHVFDGTDTNLASPARKRCLLASGIPLVARSSVGGGWRSGCDSLEGSTFAFTTYGIPLKHDQRSTG